MLHRISIGTVGLLLVTSFSEAQYLTFCGERVPVEYEHVNKALVTALRKRQPDIRNTRLQEKSELYLPYISIVLRQYKLPDDLKFLAVTESRLDRHALSKAGAGGMWQFMPATAAAEGLQVNGKLDDRGRVIHSTHAACRMLNKLYSELGSWSLVAAAYNWGIGNVKKAMRSQGKKNYYDLKLPSETSRYVFEALAFKVLYQPSVFACDPHLANARETQQYSDTAQAGLHEPDNILPVASAISKADTVIVAASMISQRLTGELVFITLGNAGISGFALPRNAIIRAFVYNRNARRVFLSGAGVDVNPCLQEYKILVFSQEGDEGIALADRDRLLLPPGKKVKLKFIKE